MNEFDIKASQWDKNPVHWNRSRTIANEIINRISLNNKMIALEYGAGTGIASFLLKDYLKEITLMDSSAEMVKIVNEKIKTSKTKNIKSILFDLELADYEEDTFDLIFTQMVLHHVDNIETIMDRFSNLLKPEGYLAIADLYPEDGSFHGDSFNGHKGFDPDNLARLLKQNKFQNINYFNCFTIDKKITDSKTKKYDIFLLTAKRE
jgi:ubiquinone/menaquinone biosynthesis C-methylase UbiE